MRLCFNMAEPQGSVKKSQSAFPNSALELVRAILTDHKHFYVAFLPVVLVAELVLGVLIIQYVKCTCAEVGTAHSETHYCVPQTQRLTGALTCKKLRVYCMASLTTKN